MSVKAGERPGPYNGDLERLERGTHGPAVAHGYELMDARAASAGWPG